MIGALYPTQRADIARWLGRYGIESVEVRRVQGAGRFSWEPTQVLSTMLMRWCFAQPVSPQGVGQYRLLLPAEGDIPWPVSWCPVTLEGSCGGVHCPVCPRGRARV